jgi:uncharacterized protein (TIGR02118 family)
MSALPIVFAGSGLLRYLEAYVVSKWQHERSLEKDYCMARMVVIYKKPEDPESFDRHYFEVHIPLAKKLPGIRKYEVSKGAIISPSGNNQYLIATLHFDSLEAIQRAFATEVGQECAADRKILAPKNSDYQMYLFDTKEV